MCVQALYQQTHAQRNLEAQPHTGEILGKDFLENTLQEELKAEGIDGDLEYLKLLLDVFQNDISFFDEKISIFLILPWQIDTCDPLLLALLRAGSAELFGLQDTPTALVVNEYVKLAHGFFGQGEPAMVHAILDKLAKSLRPGN